MGAGDCPSQIRVSIGSAILLGLAKGKMDAQPTTLYLLTYHKGKCAANCGFCSQARTSTSRADMLSRVTWPPFSTKHVIEELKAVVERRLIARVCVQAMNYRGVFADLVGLVKEVRRANIPISVSCQPLTGRQIKRFSTVGVDRICIPLDLPTKGLFEQVKGTLAGAPYRWERHLEALKHALHVFGRGRVSTHLIVGLGESDKELIEIFQVLVDMGVYPSLFAFTPIPGTRMAERSQPPIQRYRKMQLAHHLMTTGLARIEQMEFDGESNLIGFGVPEDALMEVVRSRLPFMTSGCPGCNRPYYNERPGGLIYNFPRKPNMGELTRIERQIKGV
jgi:biotin synthase-related radical SAM superfamily protein